MRIVILGLSITSSWGNGHATPYRAILKALSRLGHQVHFYEKDLPYYARHRDLDHPDFGELHLYSDWDSVCRSALTQAADSDVVICASFCPEGARIVDETQAAADHAQAALARLPARRLDRALGHLGGTRGQRYLGGDRQGDTRPPAYRPHARDPGAKS